MGQTDDFFSDLKEWSTRKLSIIEKYVDGFSKILGSKFREVYYVDGFAGKGKYDNGDSGSPVLAAETALRYQQGNRQFTLRCINVEKVIENYINLCAETAKFGGLVTNYAGTFEQNIDGILACTNNYPTFFFLDDFGIKGTSWDSVEKVIGRKGSTDLWIRFDHKTVRRLSGFYNSEAKEADGKVSALQNLFGISNKDYLLSRLDGPTPEKRIDNAVLLYIEQLEKAFGKFGKKGFAASYPIISMNGECKYHLLFACANQTAATLASSIVNGTEEQFQHEKGENMWQHNGQMSLFNVVEFTEEQLFERKVQQLKQAITGLSKNTPFTRTALHYELMLKDKKWFGKIRTRHLTKALRELISENPPKVAAKGAPGNYDSVFIILE
jgi:three-Cys-motif partner protein